MGERRRFGPDAPIVQTSSPGEGVIGAVYGEHMEALRSATIMMIDDEPQTLDVTEAFLSEHFPMGTRVESKRKLLLAR